MSVSSKLPDEREFKLLNLKSFMAQVPYDAMMEGKFTNDFKHFRVSFMGRDLQVETKDVELIVPEKRGLPVNMAKGWVNILWYHGYGPGPVTRPLAPKDLELACLRPTVPGVPPIRTDPKLAKKDLSAFLTALKDSEKGCPLKDYMIEMIRALSMAVEDMNIIGLKRCQQTMFVIHKQIVASTTSRVAGLLAKNFPVMKGNVLRHDAMVSHLKSGEHWKAAFGDLKLPEKIDIKDDNDGPAPANDGVDLFMASMISDMKATYPDADAFRVTAYVNGLLTQALLKGESDVDVLKKLIKSELEFIFVKPDEDGKKLRQVKKENMTLMETNSNLLKEVTALNLQIDESAKKIASLNKKLDKANKQLKDLKPSIASLFKTILFAPFKKLSKVFGVVKALFS